MLTERSMERNKTVQELIDTLRPLQLQETVVTAQIEQAYYEQENGEREAERINSAAINATAERINSAAINAAAQPERTNSAAINAAAQERGDRSIETNAAEPTRRTGTRECGDNHRAPKKGDRIWIKNRVSKPANWSSRLVWNEAEAKKATVTKVIHKGTNVQVHFVSDNGVRTWRGPNNVHLL